MVTTLAEIIFPLDGTDVPLCRRGVDDNRLMVADWLDEQGRDLEAARLRRGVNCVVRDGEVLDAKYLGHGIAWSLGVHEEAYDLYVGSPAGTIVKYDASTLATIDEDYEVVEAYLASLGVERSEPFRIDWRGSADPDHLGRWKKVAE